jgi:hypothetical protein
MFRVTYAIACSTLGARFQQFCLRRIDLALGDVDAQAVAPRQGESAADFVARLERERALNFAEVREIEQRKLGEHGFDEVVLLRLCVPDPSQTATTLACDQPGMTLMFGFALALRKKIVYLRVQDHLRKMGLGQRALRRMSELGYTELVREVTDKAEEAQRFRRLFSLAREAGRSDTGQGHRRN